MTDAAASGDVALRDRLVALGRAHGLAAVGVCDARPFDEARDALESRRAEGLHGDMAFTYRNPARSTDPSRIVEGARSMVVGAHRYDTQVPERPDRPAARVARYATEDHYAELRAALRLVADELKAAGHRAVVVADDNAMVDRAVAVRAGIGWYGKSSNVLLPGQGSWFVLGSVVTDAELPPTGAPLEDGCGTCARCLDGCPTGAIVAPGVVDARRCLAWHLQTAGEYPREFRVALGDRIYGCDECQEVCPPSKVSARREQAVGPAPDGDSGSWVDLEWLLRSDDDELLERLGRWYVPRREARYLRRNALVVLGNTADPTDPQVVDLLERHLDGEDDLVAAHAAWAAVQLGRHDLLDVDRRRTRPAIADELAAIAIDGESAGAGRGAADVPSGRERREDGGP